MADNQEPQSLKSLFATADEKRRALETGALPTADAFHTTLANTISLHQACVKLVRQLSVFSPNECLEDIATSDLPYLVLNYHLAELLQRQTTPPSSLPASRVAILREARLAYEDFLTVLDAYELLGEPLSKLAGGVASYAKLWERYREDPNLFSTVGSGSDPAARRNAKMANYKAEKALKNKLAVLRRDPRYGASEDGRGHGDEEVVREVHLAHVAFCTHMTFQSLESLNREMEVLAMAPSAPPPRLDSQAAEDERRRRGVGQDGYSERLDAPLSHLQQGGPLLTKEGKPLQPFTIVGTRTELQKGVFRPGHNLPTMTVDEYLEEERRRGNIIEGGGAASYNRPEPDEDDMERADQETYKARQWDDFKDENPKGAGNTLNRG
jgi:immunoglobulin-binding protein 1